MPSKYRPQIFGWFDDLDKIASYKYESHNDRLIYANNNYCAFIRIKIYIKHKIVEIISAVILRFLNIRQLKFEGL